MNKHALHEAAHAVVGWLSGLIIEGVTIEGDLKFGENKHEHTPFRCGLRGAAMLGLGKISKDDIYTRINVHLAATAIESKKFGSPLFGGLNDAWEAICFLTCSMDPEVRSVIRDIHGIMDKNGEDWKSGALEFFVKYGEPVRGLMDSHQTMKSIDALAGQLINRKTLTGFEVASFLEKNWQGSLPEKVKPAGKHPTGLTGNHSLENTVSAGERLIRMAIDILHEYRPKNDSEEEIIESAIRQALQTVFIFNDLLAKHESTEV
ncbi:MAG TPA: hypothetical protein VMW95_04235, partial [Desulfobacterales bacterium]|nr:hypothetical protein [Desulfobacterales bacterium]